MPLAARYAEAYDFEKITVSTSAVSLTESKVFPAHQKAAFEALISVENKEIRYRLDGGAPTSTDGHFVAAGSSFVVTGANNLKRLQLIRAGDGDATVQVTYFR